MSDHAHKPAERPGDLEVPELDFALPSPSSPGARASGTTPKTSAVPAAAPSNDGASAYGGQFDFGDEEMEIDRNAAPTSLQRTNDVPASVLRGGKIELGTTMLPDERLSTRSHVKVPERTDWAGGVVSTLLVAAFAAGTGFALTHFVHRPAGWNVTPLAQRALDGGSAIWSGASSMTFLALAITLAIMAMYARPRSLGYGLSAMASLIIGVTLMIITFSVGPDGAPEVPPDGAILVPWLLALVPLGVALRLLRNGWDACFEGEAKTRLLGVVLATVSAGAAFAAAELLFGAGLARFL